MNAVRPSLAKTGGPLIVISSPYAKRGAVFEAYRQHFGENGDKRILIAKGASHDFNPNLPQSVVERGLERDRAWAMAEYRGEFRVDLELFISREAVEALVDTGVVVRAPLPGLKYSAFADPSGGGGGDAFTLGIAHREQDGIVVLDYIAERRPPFNASLVIEFYAKVLKEYCCAQVAQGSSLPAKLSELGYDPIHRGTTTRITPTGHTETITDRKTGTPIIRQHPGFQNVDVIEITLGG